MQVSTTFLFCVAAATAFGLRGAYVGAADAPHGAELAWFETQPLLPSDDSSGYGFGNPVCVSGNTIVVGALRPANAPVEDDAYAFTPRSDGTWPNQPRLTATHRVLGDGFGYSVAAADGTVVVGAPNAAVDAEEQGSAYVFALSDSNWAQRGDRLFAADGAAFDHFGTSVSISGDTLAIAHIGRVSGAAAVHLFTRQGDAWSPMDVLPGRVDEQFGFSVSLSGETLAVGAPFGTNNYPGKVYLFTLQGGHWVPLRELSAPDGAGGDHFGNSVSVSGNTVAVGAPLAKVDQNLSQGIVYVFDLSSGGPPQKLSARSGVAYGQFGNSVSVFDKTLVAGAPFTTVGSNVNQGIVSVFGLDTVWTEQQQLPSMGGMPYETFGIAVSLSGTTAVVGTRNAAYVERLFWTNGSSCTSDGQCGSGHCVSGTCCDRACSCGACTGGVCAALLTRDPAACSPYVCRDTSLDCPTSCAAESDCIASDHCENGQCVPKLPSGASCVVDDQCEMGHCFAGACCADACGPCGTCLSGACATLEANAGNSPCAPFACDGVRAACPTRCSVNGDCVAPYACLAGQCVARAANGSTCGLADQCESNVCFEGVCCADTCGPCGTCSGGHCTLFAASLDGAPSCGAYRCDGSSAACPLACAQSSDCAAGYLCRDGRCGPPPTDGAHCADAVTASSGGTLRDCAPYRCDPAAGACRRDCNSVADCASPFVCDFDGQCVAPPAIDLGRLASCSVGPRSSQGARQLVAAIFVAGLLVRRRASRASFRCRAR